MFLFHRNKARSAPQGPTFAPVRAGPRPAAKPRADARHGDKGIGAQPPRRRNFIIVYSLRVGSSALINTLGRLEGFTVPIFEELDWYAIKERGQDAEVTAGNIHDSVAALFETARKQSPGRSIGFKWRIFGEPERLADALRSNDVVLFNLMRGDLLELACSLYLTDVVYGEFNGPQFTFANSADAKAREEILARYRLTAVTADAEAFFSLCESYVDKEAERLVLLRRLRAAGAEIYTILYEDFAYQRFHFLNRMLALLGHGPLTAYPSTTLTKITSSYPSELFTNRAELVGSARMLVLLRRWEGMVHADAFPSIFV